MLKEVKRPDKQKVTFTYDALGRRLTKHFRRTTTHFLWSGNVPLHEWKETFELNYSTGLYDLGTEHSPTTCPFKYQGQYYDSEVELCYNRSDRIAKKSHKCNKKKILNGK